MAYALQLQEEENRNQGGWDNGDDNHMPVLAAGGSGAPWGEAAGGQVAMAQPVESGGNVVATATPYGGGMDGSFHVLWRDMSGPESRQRQPVPSHIEVSITGVRVETTEREVVLYRDFYHIKSWDVSPARFALRSSNAATSAVPASPPSAASVAAAQVRSPFPCHARR